MMITRKKGEWLYITIPSKWTGLSVEKLFKTIWMSPKKLTHQFRMEKCVKVNGEDANWTTPLTEGDVLAIRLFQEKEFPVIPTFHNIDILYEDDHLLVVNKKAQLDTHPNSPEQTNTLANAVAYYLQAKGEYLPVRHVHRLDRDTTGAVLFAKHPFIGALLDAMLEKRLIKRTYIAITHGLLKKKQGIIDTPIGRDRHHATRRRVSPSGQPASTSYECVTTIPNRNLSIVTCTLATGRTHQIRVHLSSIGHPLAGDILYGGKPIFSRQALHAAKLAFTHPLTEEYIIVHAPFLDQPSIFTEINVEEI